jgi:hypothetical protein
MSDIRSCLQHGLLVKTTKAILAMGLSMAAATAVCFADDSSTKLPEVKVEGRTETSTSELSEERLVGPNQQPEWTTQRRFATTRVYVLEPWQFEFEQWWKGKFLRGSGTDNLFQSELELGLPYRFQLDVYENLQKSPGSDLKHKGNQVELRYAFAEWGKIPLNPAIYGEWKFNHNDPDAYEVKLLLGEQIAPRWHWGANLFYEQEVGGGRESEMGFAQGVSYTLADEKFSVGMEMNLERASGPNLNGTPAVEFLIGPSAQWRPTSRIHLNLVPLFGTTEDSPRVEAFVIFGFDFWRPSKNDGGYQPSSTRSR